MLVVLKGEATSDDIRTLCDEARSHDFFAVCVHGVWVKLAHQLLEGSDVKVVTVVGFPFGANDPDVKRFETEVAIDQGAHEIDMVLNIGRMKEGKSSFILREIRDVVESADEHPVKVILETGLLSHDEIIQGCHIAMEAGASFVKTSTGFGPRGASLEDIRLMKGVVADLLGIKASGGIRDVAFAGELIEAGATRLGTSSGVALVTS